MNINVSPKTVFIWLLFFIIFLLFANIIGIIIKYYFHHDHVYEFISKHLIPLFDFDTEKNIPTLYSSFSLLLCAILLSTISIAQKKLRSPYFHWLGLVVIFLFLSIDETVSLHEKLIFPVRKAFNTSGLFHFAWVIPYGVALALFIVFYCRFLINLPKIFMILFILSGVTYISGALGFEMISGLYASSQSTGDVIYSLITTCEEFLEMLGVVIFIYTLLSYIATQFNNLTLTINSNELF